MNFPGCSVENHIRMLEPANCYLYFLQSRLKRLLMAWNCLSLQVRTYTSPPNMNTPSFPLVYIGNLENIHWLERSLFQYHQLAGTEKIPLWKCRSEIKQNIRDKTHTVIDINRILARFLPKGGFTSYPWIRQAVSLDSEEYKNRRYQLMGEFRRLMRKHGYATGITSAKEDIRHFYRDLYLPFVSYRFQATAYPRSYAEIAKAVSHGFILQIFHKNEWIAGDVVRISGNEIQGIASGLLPDYSKSSRLTARAVMYPILFEWAASKGYRRINLLRSRANLQDGVFASKKHRGAVAEVDSWPHTAIKFYIPPESALPDLWKTQLVEYLGVLIPLDEALNRQS